MLKTRITEITGIHSKKIPSRYQIIGHVFLVKMFRLSKKEKGELASAVMKILPYIKTVAEICGIKGEFREPRIRKIKGDGFVTTHKEHGIIFKLDVQKIMFSKGNHAERKRMMEIVKSKETIVDMFAGIGYFSLGIAKANPSCKIYAVEKNPLAFRYLKENIKLNKLYNVFPICDDCRNIKIRSVDRVIMGYLPGTEDFLKNAVKFVKKNGLIHYHNSYTEKELWKKPESEIKKYALKSLEKELLNLSNQELITWF